jgi:hypothetical protein
MPLPILREIRIMKAARHFRTRVIDCAPSATIDTGPKRKRTRPSAELAHLSDVEIESQSLPVPRLRVGLV